MSQKSTKAQDGATTAISFRFDGGLNYAQSPSQIADNELTRAYNIIYNASTGTPETRPGTVCVTAAALPAPIRKIYYYEKDATYKWLLAVSGTKLYYLNVNAWVEIGTDIIASATVTPAFITYNTYLLIADGSTNLRKWDGTTLTSLTDGLNATAMTEIGARVVINSSVDPDLVTFSGIENETMWDTADLTNPAIGLRAGFGDNMAVNCFGTFGTDLIVSKRGDAEKRIYRINTADVPTNWNVSKLSANNCAQNAHCMIGAFNNVFFVDTNGFKSIKGVTEYGDLQIEGTGDKVNTAFKDRTCLEMTYIPMFSAIWYFAGDRIYAYHSIAGKAAFTELNFAQGAINSLIQAGDVLYLAGANGYLYKMDGTAETDEVTPSVFSGYQTLLVTKRYNYPQGGIVKRTAVEFKPTAITGNTPAYIKAIDAEGAKTLLRTVNVLVETQELYDATQDLDIALTSLGAIAGTAWVETSTNRVRGNSLQFQIDSASGRFGIEGLQAEIALVGR